METRTFYVIGKEAQALDALPHGTWYETLEDAKNGRLENLYKREDVSKISGIYMIRVDCEGYYINGDWVPMSKIACQHCSPNLFSV